MRTRNKKMQGVKKSFLKQKEEIYRDKGAGL
jgi:hypothetical protein